MKQIVFKGLGFGFELEADKVVIGEGMEGLTAHFYKVGEPDELAKPFATIKVSRHSADHDRLKAALLTFSLAQ